VQDQAGDTDEEEDGFTDIQASGHYRPSHGKYGKRGEGIGKGKQKENESKTKPNESKKKKKTKRSETGYIL
jgi:hypothetical protein